MGKLRDQDLLRYFDAELSPRRAHAVESQLKEDPQAQRKLALLERTRDLVRETILEENAPSFDHLYANVRARITQEPPVRFAEHLRAWLKRYRFVVGSAVVAGAVVLALVGIALDSPVHNQCNIESIDIGPGVTSTIITPTDPDDANASTVIWIDDDQNGGEGGSI
jgi:anti-sigma factor RsiW